MTGCLSPVLFYKKQKACGIALQIRSQPVIYFISG
jgi:hypothetical protein